MRNKDVTGADAAVLSGNPIEQATEYSYQAYRRLGGIINEKDFASALDRASRATMADPISLAQADIMAHAAGIDLHNTEGRHDPRAVLYAILRGDTNTEQVQHHYSQMSDQRLFAEALRMRGDAASLQKLTASHPHIFQ